MGKRKPPMPRGYDPGGFRFPGRGPFIEQAHPYAAERLELRPEHGVALVGDGARLLVVGAMAVAAPAGRRRHGR